MEPREQPQTASVTLGSNRIVLPTNNNVLSIRAGDTALDLARPTDAMLEAAVAPTPYVPVTLMGLLADYDAATLPPPVHLLVFCIDRLTATGAKIEIDVPYVDGTETFTIPVSAFEQLKWRERWVLRALFVYGDDEVFADRDWGDLYVFDVSDEMPAGFVPSITLRADKLKRGGGGAFGEQTYTLLETIPELEVAVDPDVQTVGGGTDYAAPGPALITLPPEPDRPALPPERSAGLFVGDSITEVDTMPSGYVDVLASHAPVLNAFYLAHFIEGGHTPPTACQLVVRIQGDGITPPAVDDLKLRLTLPLAPGAIAEEEDVAVIEIPGSEAVEAPGATVEFRVVLVAGHDPDLSEVALPASWPLVVVDATDESGLGFPEAIDVEVEAVGYKRRLACIEVLPDLEIGEEPEVEAVSGGTTYEAPAPAVEETSWLEIELVDAEGEPQGGVSYRVVPPGGGEPITGTLNALGVARIDGLPPGSCQVTFPEIDATAWEMPTSSAPSR